VGEKTDTDAVLEDVKAGEHPVQEPKRLGVKRNQAIRWANSGSGYWSIANSWVLSTTLSNKRLHERGGDGSPASMPESA
jgi:hypothetical protein